MVAVGIEVWQMSKGIMFDNILITTDKSVADQYAQQTFFVKQPEEKLKNKDDASSDEDDLSFYGRLTTFIQYIQETLEQFLVEVQRNRVVGIATAIAVLIPLGVCIMAFLAPRAPKRAPPTSPKEAPKEAAAKEEPAKDTSKPSATKRTNKPTHDDN